MDESNNQNADQKGEDLKKGFRTGQYIYIAIYVSLVIALIVMSL